jgi:hypothetical protein
MLNTVKSVIHLIHRDVRSVTQNIRYTSTNANITVNALMVGSLTAITNANLVRAIACNATALNVAINALSRFTSTHTVTALNAMNQVKLK